MSSINKTISIEDLAGSANIAETELVIYSCISNPDGLSEASSKETHIQVEAKLGENGRCRVRETIKDGISTYTYTFKVPTGEHAGVSANEEFTTPVSKSFFEGFKRVADTIQEKTRYVFLSEKISLNVANGENTTAIEIPVIKYEVDVFTKVDRTITEWCKIDVEVDSILEFINQNYPEIKDVKLLIKVSHLPFLPKKSFIGDHCTDAEKEFVNKLWDTEFKQVLNGENGA